MDDEQSLSQWINSGPSPHYEGGSQVARRSAPVPSSWSGQRVAKADAYAVEERMYNVGRLAIRGVESIVDIHECINSLGNIHPILAGELRPVEETVALCVPELIIRYMGR